MTQLTDGLTVVIVNSISVCFVKDTSSSKIRPRSDQKSIENRCRVGPKSVLRPILFLGRTCERGPRAKRARPFVVSVNAVVSIVLFDQNLNQKLARAGFNWPASNPGWPWLAIAKIWVTIKNF